MTILYTAIFLLPIFFWGCFTSPNLQNSPEKQIELSYINPSKDFKETKPFFINGGIFSISRDSVIYYVDSENKFVVRKANLQNPEGSIEFINLKEWLKKDNLKDFEIDDLWCDSAGRLVLAESTTGKILRISQDARKLENLADSYDGYRFTKIRGLSGNQAGQIFFGTPNAATIYGFDPVAGTLNVINEDLIRSNDFSMDRHGDRLLVAESVPNRIVVFEMNSTETVHLGWDLIQFPTSLDEPISLDLLDNQNDLLAVLTKKGSSLLLFDLANGGIKKHYNLPDRCLRVRYKEGWFYLLTDRGIIRIINSFD
jgi:sugar lactone lactonase YvrE